MRNSAPNTIFDIASAALFTVMITIGAWIVIPTPLIPVTMQCMFVLLAADLLGPVKGTLSVVCYMCLGLIGLPVFSSGGGISYVLNPTFGYILGFILAAFVIGRILKITAKKWPNLTFKNILLANLAGIFLIYLVGLTYFVIISNVYLDLDIPAKAILLNCALLPLPGDVFTCIIASIVCQKLIPILRADKLISI